MPIALGRPSERTVSSNPAELLIECHDRIRQAMRGARGLAAAAEGDPVIAPTAEAVHRYFSVALPLHSSDEDESLAPRLFTAGVPDELADAVQAMTVQHGEIDAVLARLLPLWARLAAEPGALEAVRGDLAADTSRLDALWDLHLTLEETRVFPHVATDLDEASRAAIVQEMRARRVAGARVSE
jgi:hemerythrin-like domain-containing protein